VTGAHLAAMQEAFPEHLVVVPEIDHIVRIYGKFDVRATYNVTVDISNPEQPRCRSVRLISTLDAYGEWTEVKGHADMPTEEIIAELEQDLIVCDDNKRAQRVYKKALSGVL